MMCISHPEPIRREVEARCASPRAKVQLTHARGEVGTGGGPIHAMRVHEEAVDTCDAHEGLPERGHPRPHAHTMHKAVDHRRRLQRKVGRAERVPWQQDLRDTAEAVLCVLQHQGGGLAGAGGIEVLVSIEQRQPGQAPRHECEGGVERSELEANVWTVGPTCLAQVDGGAITHVRRQHRRRVVLGTVVDEDEAAHALFPVVRHPLGKHVALVPHERQHAERARRREPRRASTRVGRGRLRVLQLQIMPRRSPRPREKHLFLAAQDGLSPVAPYVGCLECLPQVVTSAVEVVSSTA